jgi:aspartyl-tRNA(Asn)/glutamyl-tRNA(Gln) amidotransferase subunit A
MNQHRGTPWNPWDADVPRTPGGSSSGSAVAVAARLAPWALGTDTGCSIRQPAAWCGITGLKTSIGRISTYGILPLSPTLDTPGPMAQTVRDVALLFDLLQGPDARDPRTSGHLPADPISTLEHGVRGLRLARLPSEERLGVAADVLDAYDRSLELLSGLGAEIVDIALPFSLVEFISMTNVTMAEAYFTHGHLVEDPRLPLDEVVRSRILAASRISAQDYLATLHRRDQMKQGMKTALAGVDAFLTPTTETVAIPLSEVNQNDQPTRLTRFVNLLDMCALSLPNGFTAERLPSSLQIVCRGYDESLALRIGQAYQQVTDWHERIPPAIGQ